MPDPTGTLVDWLEEWPLRGGWHCTRDEVQRLVDEIGRLREQMSAYEATLRQADSRIDELAAEVAHLREQNHALQLRIQDAWKRIETLEQDPPADQQVDLVKAWGWVHVANYHDARPGRDGDGVKRCNHLDVDWCSQRDKGRMVPVFRPPIGATDA